MVRQICSMILTLINACFVATMAPPPPPAPSPPSAPSTRRRRSAKGKGKAHPPDEPSEERAVKRRRALEDREIVEDSDADADFQQYDLIDDEADDGTPRKADEASSRVKDLPQVIVEVPSPTRSRKRSRSARGPRLQPEEEKEEPAIATGGVSLRISFTASCLHYSGHVWTLHRRWPDRVSLPGSCEASHDSLPVLQGWQEVMHPVSIMGTVLAGCHSRSW